MTERQLKARALLKEYWGYDRFRPQQAQIIDTVLAGRDVLGLLPTGGGKSLCFQVPALCQDGLCLVISPLIALMEDQVQNLRKRGIKAAALHSGLGSQVVDDLLENAAQGRYKLLYLSPERLETELFQARLPRLNISLLAVDEAHCISEWGHDFRPAYRRIADLREKLPSVPTVALTATATPEVAKDIQEQLKFRQAAVYRQSFRRANLFYSVIQTEDKWRKTQAALQKAGGNKIVYLRNRKATVATADWLKKAGFSVEAYHGGMTAEKRSAILQNWLKGSLDTVVCTNAFGMGIDNPQVRVVIHLDLPDSLEAYFQEAGRAGRDGEEAHALVILGPADVSNLKQRYLADWPDKNYLKVVYRALGSYLQIAEGSGEGLTFPFTLTEFCKQYNLQFFKTRQALDILAREGWLELEENFGDRSRLKVIADRRTLYDYQLRHPKADQIIKLLLRSYGGLDLEYTPIDEFLLARRLQINNTDLIKILRQLDSLKLISYQAKRQGNSLTLLRPRANHRSMRIAERQIKERFLEIERKVLAVANYVEADYACRSRILLKYFGETDTEPCGKCDYCRQKKVLNQAEGEQAFLRWVSQAEPNLQQAAEWLSKHQLDLKILRKLMDEDIIKNRDGTLVLRKKTN